MFPPFEFLKWLVSTETPVLLCILVRASIAVLFVVSIFGMGYVLSVYPWVAASLPPICLVWGYVEWRKGPAYYD